MLIAGCGETMIWEDDVSIRPIVITKVIYYGRPGSYFYYFVDTNDSCGGFYSKKTYSIGDTIK